MNWTFWVACGSILGALGVAAGAFGAHALKTRLPVEDLAIFETAARYQMYHALGLLAVGFVASKIDSGIVRSAGWMLIFGSLVFSGTLYALVLTGVRVLGAVTPIGGLALILAWILLAIGVLKGQMGS
jgi:uncharacterized membrane protein YgdD (TMEM256/DUF423 family)